MRSVSKRPPGRPRGSRVDPPRGELLDIMQWMVGGLDALVGRWCDSITAEIRAELAAIRAPGEDALIRSGRRGAQLGEK